MDTERSLVSVVVPTKDSIRTIERCLKSIREQTWSATELVVVDNFSTDGTWEVAQKYAHQAIQAGPERSTQRNLGVARSNGEWILWIDSDMELPATILEHAVEAAMDEAASAVFIPEVTVGDGYWTRCRALERSCCTEETLVQSPRLIDRSYLVDTEGFRTSLAGTEDAELRTRMIEDGLKMTSIKDLIIHDEGRLELAGIIRKRYYYGKGLAWYKQQHPGALGDQAKAAVGAYVSNWRRLAAEPAVAVGVLGMRGLEFVAYGLGAAVGWKSPAPDAGSVGDGAETARTSG
ncbi:MAG TPA: glycosyltransferase family A protein [Acidimicrobiales bacterium]|nr:glycosyltransferase family A protein [Acidimicrobiales bacterium]